MPTIPYDVAGPGFLVLAGVGLGLSVVWYLGVIVVEAVVLLVMRWAGLWRSLLAAFLMNTLTTLVGLFFAGGFVLTSLPFLWLAAAFVASLVLEWGVMALMDRKQARRALLASLVANVITYVPFVLITIVALRS